MSCSEKTPKSYTREYNIWRLMKRRCNNPKDPHYYLYGGRGVKVCDEWQKSDNFLKWAYANGYADNLELDRKDPDGDYEPNNCRWVTHAENIKRKRKPYTTEESWIRHSQRTWKHCKDLGLSMKYWPEPKQKWEQ